MSDVKLLTDPANYAVVHLPGRAYPGIVFAGDSLNILIGDIERAVKGEVDELNSVLERLRAVQAKYEAVLEAEGMSLPYRPS